MVQNGRPAILEFRFWPKTIGFFHYVLSMAMPNMKLMCEYMTRLETPQGFEHFYTKWPPEASLFFPIDAKNHRVLVIWDLNGYGEYEFDWCICDKVMACTSIGVRRRRRQLCFSRNTFNMTSNYWSYLNCQIQFLFAFLSRIFWHQSQISTMFHSRDTNDYVFPYFPMTLTLTFDLSLWYYLTIPTPYPAITTNVHAHTHTHTHTLRDTHTNTRVTITSCCDIKYISHDKTFKNRKYDTDEDIVYLYIIFYISDIGKYTMMI